MIEGGHDLLLGQTRAVIAVDQQGYPAAVVDVPRPTHCLVEAAKLLEEMAILIQRRDGLRASWTGIDTIGHGLASIVEAPHREFQAGFREAVYS
jgi:hypothetical protein